MAVTKLPNDIYAEKAVLGAMLISHEALVIGLGSLDVSEFYEENRENQIVFEAMKRLNENKSVVDIGTVYNELSNMKQVENIGGLDYLEKLSESAIGLTQLEHYIKIIKDACVLRMLLISLDEIKDEYGKGIEGTVSDFIAASGDKISRIVEQRRVAEFISLEEYLKRVNHDLGTMRAADEDSLIGISTGYSKLNNYTNGWQSGNMIVLAARPSVGKTALALNFALTAAKKTGKTIAFFSLEMSGDSLTKRLLGIESGVDLTRITTGKLNRNDMLDIQSASKRLAKLKLFIDDTPSIKMGDLLSKAQKLQNAHNDLGMILIDYIGLITSNSKVESRQIEVSEYSRRIKDLARTLKIPVIVLCQLSREVDKREGKEPIMSDLRESGAIEQDADLIMLLSSKEVKKENKKQANADDQEKQAQDFAASTYDKILVKVNLAKNRNGQTGYTFLLFQKKWSLFSDLTSENESEFYELLSGDSDAGDIKKPYKKKEEA